MQKTFRHNRHVPCGIVHLFTEFFSLICLYVEMAALKNVFVGNTLFMTTLTLASLNIRDMFTTTKKCMGAMHFCTEDIKVYIELEKLHFGCYFHRLYNL